MYNLSVLFEDDTSRFSQWKAIAAGQTLLEVLLHNGIEIGHDCGGICHCTTCHVYINRGENFIEEKSTRESDFMVKVKGHRPTSRLACQCLLLEGSGEIMITVPAVQKAIKKLPSK